MLKDFINELKAIDDRLEPMDISFYNNFEGKIATKLIYKDLKCVIGKTTFVIYSYEDDKVVHHLIYSNEYTKIFDLIMLLYNNKEKITEIVLKYV